MGFRAEGQVAGDAALKCCNLLPDDGLSTDYFGCLNFIRSGKLIYMAETTTIH